jgi:hypothetical protein
MSTNMKRFLFALLLLPVVAMAQDRITASSSSVDLTTVKTAIQNVSPSPANPVRLQQLNAYQAWGVALSFPDTNFLFMSEGRTHVYRNNIIRYTIADRGNTIVKRDTFYLRAPGGNARSNLAGGVSEKTGTACIFYAESDSVITSWLDLGLYRSTDNGRTFTNITGLPKNGTLGFSPTGPMRTLLPSGELLQLAYGSGGTNKVYLLHSTDDGLTWTVKATIYSGSSPLDESTLEVISGSDATAKLVCWSRNDVSYPEVFYSSNGGTTWTDGGQMTAASSKSVAPWSGKLNGNPTVLWTDRASGAYQITAFEYNAQQLATFATGVFSSAIVSSRIIYESVDNIKAASTNLTGSFGYPCLLTWGGGRTEDVQVPIYDMWPGQLPPYTGADTLSTDIVLIPYQKRVVASIYPNATQTFTNNGGPVQINFSQRQLDTYGSWRSDSLWFTAPKDARYLFTFNLGLSSSPGGRRIFTAYKYDAAEPSNNARRVTLFTKEVAAFAASAQSGIDGTFVKEVKKGEVVKFFLEQISGTADLVMNTFSAGDNFGIKYGLSIEELGGSGGSGSSSGSGSWQPYTVNTGTGGTLTGYQLGNDTTSIISTKANALKVAQEAAAAVSGSGGAVSSLTTTGTSGAATLSGGVLNIPNYSSGGGSTYTVANGFMYDSVKINGVIKQVNNKAQITEDFVAATLNNNAQFAIGFESNTGTSADVVPTTDVTSDGHVGTALIQTGTTATGQGRYLLGSTTTKISLASTLHYRYRYVVYIPTLSDGTETYKIQLGPVNTTNGFEVDYGSALGTDWQCISYRAGVATTTATGVTVTTGWHTVEIEWYNGVTKFYIDNDGTYTTPTVTHSNTQSVAVAQGIVVPLAQITKSAGTTNRGFNIDIFQMRWYKEGENY